MWTVAARSSGSLASKKLPTASNRLSLPRKLFRLVPVSVGTTTSTAHQRDGPFISVVYCLTA
jgi:hypothetical protein